MSARPLLAGSGLAIAVLLLVALPAMAACAISTTGVNFGTYDVFATAPRDWTGSVTYRCTVTSPLMIILDKGGATTFNPRQMRNGSKALNYNLYLDASRTIIWGDGTGGTHVYTDPAPVKNQSVTVTIFGRIPAGQDVNAGSYSNTITVTINF